MAGSRATNVLSFFTMAADSTTMVTCGAALRKSVVRAALNHGRLRSLYRKVAHNSLGSALNQACSVDCHAKEPSLSKLSWNKTRSNEQQLCRNCDGAWRGPAYVARGPGNVSVEFLHGHAVVQQRS